MYEFILSVSEVNSPRADPARPPFITIELPCSAPARAISQASNTARARSSLLSRGRQMSVGCVVLPRVRLKSGLHQYLI